MEDEKITKVPQGRSNDLEKRYERDTQSRADELEERLIDFAVRIVNLSANLPKTPAGKHISGQILRSGTSPAPNYGEAEAQRAMLTSSTRYESS